jgi:SAM-dependent methyltransferase
MNPREYEQMAAVESTHWWYQGLRDCFGEVLQRAQFRTASVILDAGCGTGQNLLWLQEHFHPDLLEGFDISERAVEISRQIVPGAKIVRADLCKITDLFEGESLDLILCSDVLYTTGVAPALPGLQQLCQRLKPGGIFLLHLPALNWLYSRHDAAVHTRSRFRRGEVIQLLEALSLKVEFVSYRMFLLFPLVVLARLPSILRGGDREAHTARSDLQLPNQMLNSVLRRIVQAENRMIGAGWRFPWGSSLVAIGRKPA